MECLLMVNDAEMNEDDCIKEDSCDIMFHMPTSVPLPFGIDEKQDEVIFVDPSCGEGKRILLDSETSISELFSVLRQFVSPVCNNVSLIVEQMLKRDMGVNDIDLTTGMTMLHYVIRAEAMSSDKTQLISVLKTLLSSGADVSQRTLFTDMNAFHLAAYFNASKSLEILLDQCDSCYLLDSLCGEFDYGSPLHIAAACGGANAAELLVKEGADINLRDDMGRTPKSCIPRNNKLEVKSIEKLKSLFSNRKMQSNPKTKKRSEKSVTFSKEKPLNSLSHPDTPDMTKARKNIACEFFVGDLILVAGSKQGVVRFVGTTQFASGIWCGIELNEPAGKNNGSINGVRYFRCDSNRGVFAPPSKLKKLPPPSPVLDDDEFLKNSCVTSSSGNVWRQIPPMIQNPEQKDIPVTNSDDHQSGLKIGMSVRLDHLDESGVIRYIGETDFAIGIWVGIELQKPFGKNNGTVQGRQYFQCKNRYGIMVRPSRVSSLNS